MQEIVECVMNVSEGRDAARLEAIADRIRAVENSFLLHFCSDPDHHRTVFSFIGTSSSIARAAFSATSTGVELIDLTQHQGVHPRIGAVDVIPFIPIEGVSMHQCVQIAHQIAGRIGRELEIPVYLYGDAATRPAFENLAQVRKEEFEKLSSQIEDRDPDFGPARVHPTAGSIAVGARQPLISFNVYLASSDVEIARSIAAGIRESSGGLPGVKALGFYLERQNRAQISMKVTNYRQTSLVRVFSRIRREARRLGSEVDSSEIVGLVPRDALSEDAVEALKLRDFGPHQILEDSIEKAIEG